MKTWLIVLAVVAAGSGVALAQEEGGRGEGRRPGARRMMESPDEMLKAGDKDADGRLSKDEFLKYAYDRFQAMPMAVTRMAAQLDADKDGKVSLEEFAASRMGEERFKAGDKDGSGFLDKPELEALAAAGPGGRGRGARFEEFIKNNDKNGDGKVTADEFTGRPEMWKRLDRNGDGVVDASDAPPPGERGGPGGPPGAGPGGPGGPPQPPPPPPGGREAF